MDRVQYAPSSHLSCLVASASLTTDADPAETANRVSAPILGALDHTSVESIILFFMSERSMVCSFWIHGKKFKKFHQRHSQTLLMRRRLPSKGTVRSAATRGEPVIAEYLRLAEHLLSTIGKSESQQSATGMRRRLPLYLCTGPATSAAIVSICAQRFWKQAVNDEGRSNAA
jgi:hypothetical protein